MGSCDLVTPTFERLT